MMARKRCDIRAIRARRAMLWYDETATHMARLIDLLDGSTPGLRAVEARHLLVGEPSAEVMSAYATGLRELGAVLPVGPWDEPGEAGGNRVYR